MMTRTFQGLLTLTFGRQVVCSSRGKRAGILKCKSTHDDALYMMLALHAVQIFEGVHFLDMLVIFFFLHKIPILYMGHTRQEQHPLLIWALSRGGSFSKGKRQIITVPGQILIRFCHKHEGKNNSFNFGDYPD